MESNVAGQERNFWVVSPNVSWNERTVSAWARASILTRMAFMGWGEDHPIGHKFAHGVRQGDFMLIARRHKGSPQIVGFGIVRGERKKRIERAETPEGEAFGSARKLRPFVNLTTQMPPGHIPFIKALTHRFALARLHPDINGSHRRVCEWLVRRLSHKKDRATNNPPERNGDRGASGVDTRVVAPQRNRTIGFEVRTKHQVRKARRSEALLLRRYRRWLRWQGRELSALKWNRLECDGFEPKRRNLIEAKAATGREHMRMAVGELLDYAYQARTKFRKLNKAILVPKRPKDDVERWLRSLRVSLIWPERGTFQDNAKEQFT